MFIKQLYTGCLSEATYYIESDKEAAIIDPLRDIESYLQLAAERNSVIKYIFETHFHADFVSGHLDLSRATNAPIIYGPGTETNFKIHKATDGEIFTLGKITIEVLHTPGHTLESSCFLVKDEKNKPHAIFTGDTLFVGDVGRPDLSSGNLGKEELAAMLYDSLHSKIMPLPGVVIVYPAHGAGSSCGKNLGPDTYSTIADEKKYNYALNAANKEQFVLSVTEGLNIPPKYFPVNAKINKEGYDSLDHVLEQGLNPLGTEELKKIIKDEDVIILDTRPETVFSQGFVPGSINIGLNGRFAEWAGSLLPFDKPIVLIADIGKEKESIVRLARVGFDKIKGYLDGGLDAWKEAGNALDMIIDIEADELAMDLQFDKNLVVVDVRRETEFADGHIQGAVNIPLSEMNDPAAMANFEDTQNLYLHCGSGYRSIIAASLFKRQGIHNLRNISGGWNSIKEQKNIETVKEKSILN
ncbi:MAG: MBL fold metallo-hydrolase [Bacteroidetes bacterium]|nr:MBL fold metallo-hydrolase [Bacteroidota bacterium]MBS1972918.1 MBL fold metallo-hydrolase [Bacteroidota bacterium]